MRRRFLGYNNKHPLSQKVTHLWKFDELSGTNYYDSKNSDNYVKEIQTGFIQGESGKFGYCVKFENNSYLRGTPSTELQMHQAGVGIPFSWGCWLKKDGDLVSTEWIIEKRESSVPLDEYSAYFANGAILFVINGPSNKIRVTTPAFSDLGIQIGEWFHIAFTHDGSLNSSNMRAYLNGVESTNHNNSSISSFHSNDEGIRLGNASFTQDYPLNAWMDQLFFSKGIQLTASEIQEIYNNGNGITL